MSRHSGVILARFMVLVAFLATWQIIASSSRRAFFVAGSPTSIIAETVQMANDGSLARDTLVTAEEGLFGLVLGTTAGSLLGLALWMSKRVAAIAAPFVVVFGTLPVFAIAPLLIVWFGIGMAMKVALATLATVFVAFNQCYRGAQNVSPELIEILEGLSASRRQVFVKAIVPGSLDWVFGSMRLNVGFCLLGAFIGEFIAADRGLGYQVMKASGLYNVPRALACALGISAIAVCFDRGAALIERQRHILIQLISVPRVAWTPWSTLWRAVDAADSRTSTY